MRTLCLAAVLLGAATALAQEGAAPRDGSVEELVVPGRTPDSLRLEIERVEAAVYERFNALNSNDDFDIHCFQQAPTGSNIPVRICAPNFVIREESRASTKILTDGRSTSANNFNRAELNLRMQQKARELTEEMQRLAREDEQLLRDLARLDELKRLQAGEQPAAR
jgi:hypothetical protein